MINVLVPEAGGIGALNIIKCLREDKRIRIVAVDAQEYAVGLYKADKKYIVLKVEDPAYFDVLLEICDRENIDILFPSFDQLILEYSKNRELFERRGIKVIVNDIETIEIASNKLLLYKKLKELIPIAETLTYEEIDLESNNLFPMIMKPIRASGSANVYKINSKDELLKYASLFQEKINEFIFQEYLDGPEYTVDMLCDFDGRPLAIVPRKRLEIKAGVTYKGVTVKNQEIDTIGKKLSEYLKFKGPICFQVGTLTKSGEIKLFEINPRICGTMIFTKNAGVNMPLLAVKLAMGEKVESMELRYKEGIVMLRYWDEMYIEREKIND